MQLPFWKKYDLLMSGKIVDLSQGDIWELLNNLDYYRINTLMIQDNPSMTTRITKWYTCKVDEQSIKSYKKAKETEMRPLG